MDSLSSLMLSTPTILKKIPRTKTILPPMKTMMIKMKVNHHNPPMKIKSKLQPKSLLKRKRNKLLRPKRARHPPLTTKMTRNLKVRVVSQNQMKIFQRMSSNKSLVTPRLSFKPSITPPRSLTSWIKTRMATSQPRSFSPSWQTLAPSPRKRRKKRSTFSIHLTWTAMAK